MFHNVNWDVNKYREEHESDDQWQLRKAFLIKWKNQYPEERLVCLARVFTNIEFMGCRYPSEVMHEVSKLSADVAKDYRNKRKTKLQRTFVSASDAAEDRAKGVKREGGVKVESPEKKSARIEFIPESNIIEDKRLNEIKDNYISNEETDKLCADKLLQRINGSHPETNSIVSFEKEINGNKEEKTISYARIVNYIEDLSNTACLDPRDFNEEMFNTPFGKFALVIRPWADMIANLMSSCATCNIPMKQLFTKSTLSIIVNDKVFVKAYGDKVTARTRACGLVWDILRRATVILVLKELWVSQNDTRVSMNDMATKKKEFGEPIEDSVAVKMMKLMGWKGGGLGVDCQGIAEPVKPNLRMVRRAGLGHEASSGLSQLKRAGLTLMRHRGIALDADLVFTSEFSAEERAVLHQCASQCGLQSKSYGTGLDRFLVVTNKLRPFTLVPAVLECGGETPKYRVYIPATIGQPWQQTAQ